MACGYGADSEPFRCFFVLGVQVGLTVGLTKNGFFEAIERGIFPKKRQKSRKKYGLVGVYSHF